MTILSAAQVAGLVINAGFPSGDRATMVAIAKAESSFNTVATHRNANGTVDRGLLQINSAHSQFNASQLLNDPQYNVNAAKSIYSSQGLRAWSTYTSGAYQKYMNEARSGVANATGVTGSSVTSTDSGSPNGTGQPAITYGPPGPQYVSAGIGTPLSSANETDSPLAGLRILGSELGGDYASVVIDTPTYTAAMETIPNLKFTIADPEGTLLTRQANVCTKGAHAVYQDLDMRVDAIEFVPGAATTGAITVSCVDDIIWRLENLTGPRTASGQSASEWIAEEMRIVGIDPNQWLLAESVPTQSQISRDVPDQSGSAVGGTAPSAWTTIVRLGRELGKRVFVSGRRLVFGDSAFAMQWTAPGPVRLSWHELDWGERFITMPTTTLQSVSSNDNTIEVKGTVPLSRAKFFRPGVPVILRSVPGLIGPNWITLMCFDVSFSLGTDTDGAQITLVAPVNPPAQPPGGGNANNSSASNGANVSGGGTDGQVARFVALALQQAGKRYVYGAYASPSNPNPTAFDCCLTVDSMISTYSRGPLPIADVMPGDMVWCWDNGTLGTRKVVAVAEQPAQPIFAVKTRNSTVRASANHPFLVLCRDKRRRNPGGEWCPVDWYSKWVRLDELVKGDLLVNLERTPQRTDPVALPDGSIITDDVAWLLGEIIGDGHVTDSGVNIAAFRSETRDRIARIAKTTWNARAIYHKTHGVMLHSKRLRDALADINMRIPGSQKRVPDLLRTLPASELRAFLAGYAEADGHFDKRGHQSYGSCSRRLIDDVRALHRSLGDKVSNVTTQQRIRPIIIKGKEVKNALPLHSFTVYPDSIRRSTTVLDHYGARRALPDRSFTVERVWSITPAGNEPTYDLEIEGVHNYIADGLVVHNSELVQWCCERTSIGGCPRTSTQQRQWCSGAHTLIPIQQGINTKGALLFANGHVAISLGNGRTIEAMDPADGVRQGSATGNRGWIAAGKIPGAQGYL